MSGRVWLGVLGLFCLLPLALTAAGQHTPEPPVIRAEAPETVIVVIGCTLRADRLGLYGNPRPTTPYLDRLGSEGVVFDEVYANAPWTRPAVASLITGRYPLVLGVDDPRPILGSSRGVDPSFVTLAESFGAAGWHTVGATANPNANAFFGMDQGFEVYTEATGLWREDRRKVSGAEMLRPFVEELSSRSGRLYGQLLLVDTHGPRSPGPLARIWVGWRLLFRPDQLMVYDAALREFDRVVRSLDRELAALGRDQRLLVLIGDHGEGLDTPAHAGAVHGRYLYDPTLHVPWILHGPGVKAGQRIGGLAESVDLLPTVLDLAGVPRIGATDGDSRAAAARGELGSTGESRIFSETYFSTEHKVRLSTPEWTLIHSEATRVSAGREELYAGDDRNQLHEVSAEHPELTRRMLDAVLALRQPLLAQQVVWQSGADDVTVKRQLKALGYME